MIEIGFTRKEFPAEMDGKLYECDVCGFDCRLRDTKIEYGYRVCPDCQDKGRQHPEPTKESE